MLCLVPSVEKLLVAFVLLVAFPRGRAHGEWEIAFHAGDRLRLELSVDSVPGDYRFLFRGRILVLTYLNRECIARWRLRHA